MNEQIAKLLIDLTNNHKNWGFKLCFLYLRSILGLPYNHKRVYRIYRELELNLRKKPKRHIKLDKLQTLAVPNDWLNHYSNERPNMGNGGFTPIQKLNMAA